MHKDTKFHYARVLLHPSSTGHKRAAPSVSFADVSPSYGEQPSRREPSFDLCEHSGRTRYVRKNFPV